MQEQDQDQELGLRKVVVVSLVYQNNDRIPRISLAHKLFSSHCLAYYDLLCQPKPISWRSQSLL